MLKNKKGNIIIVVVCVVLGLMGSLGYLLKNTTSRVFTTKKLSSTSYAREFANTLAKLSVQYLNQRLIDKNDEIAEILSLPLKEFKDSEEKNLLPKIKSLTELNDSKNILDLIAAKSSLRNLKIEKLYWQVFKDDFKAIDVNNQNPYSREKYGLIHIFMNFSYAMPGKNNTSKERNKESYHFVSDVNVVANIIPVLSRFSLYIDDALDGNEEDLERFNVVDTNANGILNDKNSNNYNPWILNNHGKNEEPINKNLKSFNKIIESSRGLIFLGGGNFGEDKGIKLGLAFGESDKRSPLGEGFQFFYNEDTGYWKNQTVKEDFDRWGENVGLLTANFGLCNEIDNDDEPDNMDDALEDEDIDDDDYNTYFDYVGGSDTDKLSSIFRLYGTDMNPSPTLVFGYVDAKYAAVKQFRFGDEDFEYDILGNYPSNHDFKEASSYNYESLKEIEDEEESERDSLYDEDLTDFAFRYRDEHSKNKLEFDHYLQEFSSKIEFDNYNKGYAYALNHTEEFPFKNNLLEGDEFKKLFKKKDKDIFIDVPNTKEAKYNNIYPDAKLGQIGEFLNVDKLNINGIEKGRNYRIAHTLTFTSTEPDFKSIDCFYPNEVEIDFINFLKNKGILVKNKLNFNGWLYINNESEDTDLILNLRGMKLISHGGIILSNGNLRIKSDIMSEMDDNKKCLTLITLGENKDIIIDDKVNRLDASLFSKGGQVILEGRGNTQYLEVNGNVVMKKIHSGENGIKAMMRGLKLNYNNLLSAIPYKNTEEEKSMLMFNLEDNPKILK